MKLKSLLDKLSCIIVSKILLAVHVLSSSPSAHSLDRNSELRLLVLDRNY